MMRSAQATPMILHSSPIARGRIAPIARRPSDRGLVITLHATPAAENAQAHLLTGNVVVRVDARALDTAPWAP